MENRKIGELFVKEEKVEEICKEEKREITKSVKKVIADKFKKKTIRLEESPHNSVKEVESSEEYELNQRD